MMGKNTAPAADPTAILKLHFLKKLLYFTKKNYLCAIMRVPRYIQSFMGTDFRSVGGVDLHFDLREFDNPDFDSGLQDKPGCYIISSTIKKFEYAKGKSPDLYIGRSNQLYRRLHDEHYLKHLRVLIDDPNYGLYSNEIIQMADKYQYMLYCGAMVDVFYCKGKQNPVRFENTLIASFYTKYRCMPIGNGARSFSVE